MCDDKVQKHKLHLKYRTKGLKKIKYGIDRWKLKL